MISRSFMSRPPAIQTSRVPTNGYKGNPEEDFHGQELKRQPEYLLDVFRKQRQTGRQLRTGELTTSAAADKEARMTILLIWTLLLKPDQNYAADEELHCDLDEYIDTNNAPLRTRPRQLLEMQSQGNWKPPTTDPGNNSLRQGAGGKRQRQGKSGGR